MSVYLEFKASKAINKKQGDVIRVNFNVVNHVCATLIQFYPEIGAMSKPEKNAFLLFLLEKSLKDRVPTYCESWNWEGRVKNSDRNDPFNASFEKN